MGLHRHPS